MAETHVTASQPHNDGPSHLSASNLSPSGGDEAVGIQPSPSDAENNPDNKFSIDEYCQRGSMWTVPMREMTWRFEKNKNKLHVLECWKYDGASESRLSPITEFKEIDEDDVGAWVHAEPPTNEGLSPVAGYKILQMDDEPEPIFKLKSQTYEALIESFKLPTIEVHMGSAWGADGVFDEEDGSFRALLPCPITHICSQNSTVLINRRPPIRTSISSIFRYDPLTNITCGYIITDYGYYDNPLMDFSFIPTQFLACPHPILIPILFIEQTVYERFGAADQAAAELAEVEQMTGFTFDIAEKKEEMELQDIVKKLGKTHAYYSTTETSFQVLKLAVDMFKRKMEYMDSEVFPDAMRGKLTRYVPRLRNRIEYLESTLQHSHLHGNIQTRLQAQQQVLFNLITQEDTRVNISLAKDSREIAAASKRDSSAMKIIAMLTTLFLPGTFIAVSLTPGYQRFDQKMLIQIFNMMKTIFAMPLFDWQNPSINNVTNQHFWIYWAVTGPLTLAIMVLVISWALWNRSNLRAEVWRARRGADEKPTTDNGSSKEERSIPGNGEGSAEPMDMKRREKWFAKAILRRRQVWRKVNIKRRNDPESLPDE
jgi:hypothetical protein